MTKLYKTDAEIRRDRADAEIRARFILLRSQHPEVNGINRFVQTISRERKSRNAQIASPRGVLMSLQRTEKVNGNKQTQCTTR